MPRANTSPALYYEISGESEARPLVLISGLGMQIIGWPQGFIEALLAQGFRVLTYDNRDVGLSDWYDDAGVPDMGGVLFGTAPAPYLLSDMADDAARLMDFLGWSDAHVVGVSMGGMIAQELVIRHPHKVRSLTSIMSTPHLLTAGMSTPEVIASMLTPRSTEREAFLAEELAAWQLTAGPAYPPDAQWVREHAVAAMERARHVDGVQRHVAAIIASPDRREGLAGVTAPTLVLHGADDPLVQIEGGEATHHAIAHSIFHRYDGLGHQLPAELWDDMATRINAIAAD
jgi:pimeloyl-ACP methyl ester carboxylesterase